MVWRPSGRSSTGIAHTRVPVFKRRSAPGPWSTISTQNSWPMTTSRRRSMIGVPSARRYALAKRSACLSACRSEPQIPQARVLTSTSPGPGAGIGTSATINRLSRTTAARMVIIRGGPWPSFKLDLDEDDLAPGLVHHVVLDARLAKVGLPRLHRIFRPPAGRHSRQLAVGHRDDDVVVVVAV